MGIFLITVGIALMSVIGPAFVGFLAAGVVFLVLGLRQR